MNTHLLLLVWDISWLAPLHSINTFHNMHACAASTAAWFHYCHVMFWLQCSDSVMKVSVWLVMWLHCDCVALPRTCSHWGRGVHATCMQMHEWRNMLHWWRWPAEVQVSVNASVEHHSHPADRVIQRAPDLSVERTWINISINHSELRDTFTGIETFSLATRVRYFYTLIIQPSFPTDLGIHYG